MPKNKFGGNKAKRSKNKRVEEDIEVPLASDTKFYGKVLRSLGENRMEIFCGDGITRIGLIPGSMRKAEWMYKDDIVLIELRNCDTDKKVCDIIHKYSKTEMRFIRSLGHLKFIEKDEKDIDEDVVFDL